MPPCPARRRKAGERTVSAETLEQFGPRPSTAADCQPDPASAWVYMVRCADGSLYSGWTNDLARRLRAHKGGKAGAKYTHAKGAVKLTYAERCTDKSAALKREAALKKLPKPEKEALAAQWTAENTITLRDAAPEDAAAVAELYNWYVTPRPLSSMTCVPRNSSAKISPMCSSARRSWLPSMQRASCAALPAPTPGTAAQLMRGMWS